MKNYRQYEFSNNEKYDYRYYETADIYDYLKENYSDAEIKEAIETDKDAFIEKLNDDLWIEDSVTGNASGSYWFSTWKAEEAISHNWDLIMDMSEEYGLNLVSDMKNQGAEFLDVSIRCYLLCECIEGALEEIEEEIA